MSTSAIVENMNLAKDTLTNFPISISGDHAYIHKQKAYTALVSVGTISAAYKIGFKTPSVASGKYVHWRPTGISSSANYVAAILYEGDAFTGGDAVTPINRYRASIIGSSMQTFAKGVTVTPSGTIIDLDGFGTSGTPNNRSGGGSKSDEELVLKANTNYVLQLTPAGETVCTAKLFWYEE